MDEQTRMMKKKLDFFLEHQIKVHIIKKSGGWGNGVLINYIEHSEVYLFNDRVDGRKHIFLEDVERVEEYIEKGEVNRPKLKEDKL